MKKIIVFILFLSQNILAQTSINLSRLNWLPKSHSFWVQEQNNFNIFDAIKLSEKKVFLTNAELQSIGFEGSVENLIWNNAQNKVLIYNKLAKTDYFGF